MKNKSIPTMSVAFIATYPPRKCGIATFTHDVVQSLTHLYEEGAVREDNLQVVALNDLPEGYDYPSEVNFEIRAQHKDDYQRAAEFLNLSSVDAISLQHEYGIFGGPDGVHVVHMLTNLKKPVVTTLHTVLQEPSPMQKETLKAIISLSTLVVVLANKGVEILKKVYDVPEGKIVMIPHGASDVPFLDTSYYKDQFQAEDRRVLLTFGLLSPNKGIEYVIEAMAEVVKAFPDVLYIVLGATHPSVKRRHGEQYRISLENRVKELALEQNVVFHNRFVTLERLIQFLVATDIYVTPYLSKEQISSGTLAYALTSGKAVISTPYWYAEELLQDGRGILVPFKDSRAIAEKVCALLADESMRNRLRKLAYQYGRQMIWREVAKRYDAVFEQAVTEYGRKKIADRVRRKPVAHPALPEIKLNHLQTLTDDTGVFQHAIYTTPNRFDGYTTDDNARALMVATMNHVLFKDDSILKILHTYLAFLNYAVDPTNNRVRNFMSYNREWLDKIGSEDSHGRTLWSLGYTIWHAPNGAILSLTNRLFKQAVKVCTGFNSPRAWAYSILGCLYYLNRFGGDTEINGIVTQLSEKLSVGYSKNRTKEWPWFEEIVTYANARMPQALVAGGAYLNNDTMIEQGLESLDWLVKIQTDTAMGYFSPIGNAGWYSKGGEKPQFDQQPVEITCTMDACYQAYRTTGNERWRQEVDRVFGWFLGKNDKNEYLYDFSTGGCFDGLQRGGINLNQGSESTLSWLAALHLMHQISHKGILSGLETDLDLVSEDAERGA